MTIIPAIDLYAGQCVRLFQGQFDKQTQYGNDPVAIARNYSAVGFDQLHVVDLDGAKSGHQQNLALIRSIVDETELAVQLGGGIRTAAQIAAWLQSGAARVVVGTQAVTNMPMVQDWLGEFGPDRLVLALDVSVNSAGVAHVTTEGWTKTATITLEECIDRYMSAGFRHLLCTDISRDGAMSGPSLKLYARIAARYPGIELQASGGVRNIGDLDAIRSIGAAAAICGRALLDGEITAEEIGQFLRAA